MTRINERVLIQLVDRQLVFMDDQTGVEVVRSIDDARQLVNDIAAQARRTDHMIVVGDDHAVVIPARDLDKTAETITYLADCAEGKYEGVAAVTFITGADADTLRPVRGEE